MLCSGRRGPSGYVRAGVARRIVLTMFQSQVRSVLDDKAERAYVDDASGHPRAERLDDGLGGRWLEVL